LSAALQFSPDDLRFLLVDFNGRSLRALDPLLHVVHRVADVPDLQAQLGQLRAELTAFSAHWRAEDVGTHSRASLQSRSIPKTVVIIDDYDATSEALSAHIDLLRQLRDHTRLHSEFGLYMWIAGYLERIGDPLIKQLLLKRSGFALGGKDSLSNLNVRAADWPNEVMPEGRAYFAAHNAIRVVQTAWVDNPQLLVNRINEQVWPGYERARWIHPVNGEQPLRRAESMPPETASEVSNDSPDIDTEGLIQDLLDGLS